MEVNLQLVFTLSHATAQPVIAEAISDEFLRVKNCVIVCNTLIKKISTCLPSTNVITNSGC